ncbi:MAG: DUF3299 domain-containing protein [Planctomycetota bacterium]
MHLPRPSFFCRASLLALGLAAFTACTKEEVAEQAAIELPSIEVAAEIQETKVPDEQIGTEARPSSLRDRITTTPAPEGWQQMWSQATTPEERRANLEKSLAAESGPFVIDLHDLGGWELDEREEHPIPDYILALDGKEFIMRGFMMPDIDFEHIRSFHLVRSLFSCCFGAPPQINEIMRVTLADEDGMDYTYNTIEIRGRLTVTFEMVDGLVEDIFRLENATYHILEFDDPNAPESFDANTGFGDFVPTGSKEY